MTAVSFAVQAFALLRLAKSTKEMKERVDAFLPKAEKLIHTAEGTIADTRVQLAQITERANDILSMTQTQLIRVDDLVADASARAKVQLDRAENVLENTLTRVNDTVNSVHGTILRPLREMSGVAAGVKAAVGHLLKGAPANVAQVTTDEEMFI
jgi:ABC-type transporter Mla subunit MlaD